MFSKARKIANNGIAIIYQLSIILLSLSRIVTSARKGLTAATVAEVLMESRLRKISLSSGASSSIRVTLTSMVVILSLNVSSLSTGR